MAKNKLPVFRDKKTKIKGFRKRADRPDQFVIIVNPDKEKAARVYAMKFLEWRAGQLKILQGFKSEDLFNTTLSTTTPQVGKEKFLGCVNNVKPSYLDFVKTFHKANPTDTMKVLYGAELISYRKSKSLSDERYAEQEILPTKPKR